MPYNLSLTNNTGLTTLADGTYDNTSTSLTLVGKNYPGYGRFLNENLIYLLENFANGTAPAHALPGQLWWDSNAGVLKVNAGADTTTAFWKQLASGVSGSTAPASPAIGDLWWNTGTSQLNVYSGNKWVVIGPAFTASTGQTGALADLVVGTTGGVSSSHVVVKFMIAGKVSAILSTDPAFVPEVARTDTDLAGFSTIYPGFNLNTTLSPNLVYYGDSNSALNLKIGGVLVPSSSFLRSDVSVPILNKLQVESSLGIEIGTAIDGNARLDISGGDDFRITSTQSGADTVFYVNKTVGGLTEVLRLDGATGLPLLQSDPSAALGIATKQYVDSVANVTIIPRSNATVSTGYSLGSSTKWYSNVWAYTFRGIASTAKYADLAEKYTTDQEYQAGTVVCVGGEAEVTACRLNTIPIGVVSEHPAYLMNEGAPGQAIALKGRVPVRVLGAITKGDGLTAGPDGNAVGVYSEPNAPYIDSTYTPYIARRFAVALESNDNEDSKLVECVIL